MRVKNVSVPYRDINVPYKEIDYEGIQYTYCVDYDHISRYRNLRQVIHSPANINNRLTALETPNAFTSNLSVRYYTVPLSEVNRLDLIANKLLGSSSYSWIIAYFNHITDGFTVREGQRLLIPNSVTDLFESGEILQPVPPMMLNLGEE